MPDSRLFVGARPAADLQALLAVLRGEHHISGLTNRGLQRVLTNKNAGQIGRILKRLRLHGLIRRIGGTYKYYLTRLGQKLLIAALKLKEHLIVPELQAISYAS
jgi:DNA-binding PadR family transcriptional regulator